MDRIRVGVFGAGVLGGYHLDKCAAHPAVELRGFYEVNESRRLEIEGMRGIQGYAQPHELISRIDAAIVATPAVSHEAVALPCIEAGKHVLVEKPLAHSHAGGKRLVEAARRQNCVLHVGHSEFFNPVFQNLLATNPRPQFMEIHRLAAFSPRGTDVAVIVDLMIHDLHLVMRLCNEIPVLDTIAATGVSVVSSDIDIANVRLSFPSGCVANLTASRISLKKMRKLRLFQKDEYSSIDLDSREFVRCRLAPAGDNTPFNVNVEQKIIPAQDALEAELTAFVDAIRGGNPRAVTGQEALDVLEISDAILARL